MSASPYSSTGLNDGTDVWRIASAADRFEAPHVRQRAAPCTDEAREAKRSEPRLSFGSSRVSLERDETADGLVESDAALELFSSPAWIVSRAVPRIAGRRKTSVVFLEPGEVWAFEAEGRLAFVHSAHGSADIDASLVEIEQSSLGASFARVHRSWLVNIAAIRALEHEPGATRLFVGSRLNDPSGVRVPVARDRLRAVRESLLGSAIGLRRRPDARTETRAPRDG
jgi:DNA-binding LytR/AlgR family response regulator